MKRPELFPYCGRIVPEFNSETEVLIMHDLKHKVFVKGNYYEVVLHSEWKMEVIGWNVPHFPVVPHKAILKKSP